MMEFIAGLAVGIAGGLAFAIYCKAQSEKIFRQLYCSSLIGQIDVVRRIEADGPEELVQQIVEAIPSQVAAVGGALAADGSTADALYAAKRFYEVTDRHVPEEIGPILARVPARKVVCYRLQSRCSANVNCLPLPTSLRPVSDVVQRRGWEKGDTLCGTRPGWFFRRPCGAPLLVGSCV